MEQVVLQSQYIAFNLESRCPVVNFCFSRHNIDIASNLESAYRGVQILSSRLPREPEMI